MIHSLTLASMEPWPPSHGYWAAVTGRRYRCCMLQWSHGLPAMDTTGRHDGFFHFLMLQWSHGLPAMDTSALRILRPPLLHASMEPWPPSHGYRAGAFRVRLVPGSFNGAMASQPWIPCAVKMPSGWFDPASMEPWPPSHGYSFLWAACPYPPQALQWSHGLPAMDTRPPPIPSAAPLSRFNGAMASQPWILCWGCYRANLRAKLQWSHGLPAMDTCAAAPTRLRTETLQWSHGLPAMDTAELQGL